MKNKILIFIDTETGGLKPYEHSLLTMAILVVKDGQIIDTAEYFIKHKIYNVEEKALEINKIDLREHDAMAQNSYDVANDFITFLKKHCDKNNKGILVGQNIQFDKNFLEAFMYECRGVHDSVLEYNNLISHRTIDLMSITAFLNLAGVLNTNGLGLSDVIKALDIEIEERDRHTALGDIVATYKAFNKMINLIGVEDNGVM